MSDQSIVNQYSIDVTTPDQYRLAATHYCLPDRETSAGAVLFNSATAVPQTFYAQCATFLPVADMTLTPMTIAGSVARHQMRLRGFDATVLTWARQDIPTMIDFVCNRHPGQTVTYFAHSIGGQLLGLVGNADRIDRAIFVSSQLGYWKLQGG